MGSITYPAFLVEEQPNEISGMANLSSRFQYVTFSRLPRREKFVVGQVYDADGNIHEYLGMSGLVLFPDNWLTTILEALIIPAFVTKLLELVFPVEPKITSTKLLTVEEFKESILDSVQRFYTKSKGIKKRQSLLSVLKSKGSYLDVINGVEDWRYYSGNRDEDGHLLGQDGEPIA